MIRFSEVGLSYSAGSPVLSGVTLTLEPGSLHFLTGRSGAGKSSLLKLLYAELKPTVGTLSLFGHDTATISRLQVAMLRRRIGVVFQDFLLLDHLSLFENVALPLMVSGHREADYRANVLEMLEWVKLSDKLDARPSELSGGERQRVGIARAMVSVPDLILADEPTGSVDSEMGSRIMALLSEMNRLGKTVLIATHDIALVRRSGAPWLHLEDGRLRRVDSGEANPSGYRQAPYQEQPSGDAPGSAPGDAPGDAP